MMQFTEEQREALTGLCKIEIKRWKQASESNPDMRYMVELMEVALATLNAPPDDWQQRAEAAETKLAELENQEPFAWVLKDAHRETSHVERNKQVADLFSVFKGNQVTPLFVRPAPAVSLAELVQEGWKLVPVEPTQEMKGQRHTLADADCPECGKNFGVDVTFNIVYSWEDMLEAAPLPDLLCNIDEAK